VKRHYELTPPAEPASWPAPKGLWQSLARLYGTADPRSLGLLRIALGLLTACDVLLKFPEVEAHYSNAGWLTNHFALFRPMSDHLFSVYFAFGSPLEVDLMLTIHLLACLLLLVGYRTKLMQILVLVFTTSLNSRNLMLENGGCVVLDILLTWTAFLPLGRRFSVDALRGSLALRHETSQAALSDRIDPERDARPVLSLAVTALLLQWSAIYFFNALQKNGLPWRDGTAVYYFLQQDRLVTWFGAWLRGALPLGLIKVLTFGTLAIEGLLPLLLLLPRATHITRMVAFGLMLLLHLSIDSVLQLGSFSWAMLVVFFAFVPPEAWAWAERRFRARRVACVVHFDPNSGASLAWCRLIKRLDALGLVTFRAIDDTSPKKAERSLCVSVEGEKTAAGWEAVLATADAMWFGRRPLQLLAPFVRRRLVRRLGQMASAPAELDQDFGLQHLPGQNDAHAEPPSAARQALGTLASSLREAVVVLLICACGTQLLLENRAVPASLKPPAAPRLFQAIVAYPRIFQGWSMFAPMPPMSDGRLVIDGRTRDGRSFDPLTGAEPVFEVHPAGSPRHNLLWGYFHIRIAEERFQTYWNGVRDFVMSHHKLTGRDQDELVSFDAYYVTQAFAPPGEKQPPAERRKLFSSSYVPQEGTSPPPTHPKSKTTKPRAQ
jgi:hypothetical protein